MCMNCAKLVLCFVSRSELYRHQSPNFRALAAKYPTTFGKFVKDDGGYEAKLDFQDAEAVRCLAETLLLENSGVHATFSSNNLCPTIPNRLAYVAVVHDLLKFSLPLLGSCEAFKEGGIREK